MILAPNGRAMSFLKLHAQNIFHRMYRFHLNYTLIFIAFAFGTNVGCSVIVGQLFGAKRYRQLKTAVYTTLIAGSVLRGSGMMKQFMIATFSDLILRAALAYVLSGMFGSIGIWLAWPIGWAVGTGLSLLFYYAKKWSKLEVC